MPPEGPPQPKRVRIDREAELLRQAADVVVELTPDGRLTFVSDAVKGILGRPAASFVGLSFLEIVAPDDHVRTLAQFRKLVETGEPILIRFRAVRGDGERVEFEATARSFNDADDRQRIVAVCRDVTEQAAQQTADLDRHAHHRAIAESSGRPAAIIGPDRRIVYSNRRFREIFGSEPTTESISRRMTAESRAVIAAARHQVGRQSDNSLRSVDFEYRRDDGSTAWYSVTWEAFRSESGERRHAILCEDITHRKKIEYALQEIARGFSYADIGSLRRLIAMLAQALEMDRLLFGLLDVRAPGIIRVVAAWQDGGFIDLDRLEIDGLPEASVARGEACIHPAGVCQLLPDVASRVGHDFVSFAGVPLPRADGSVLGLIGGYSRQTIRDTNLVRTLLSSLATHSGAEIARHRAEAETRANQARFDAIARQAPDILAELDSSGRLTFVSRASLAILGLQPESLLGRPIEELIHPDDRKIVTEELARLGSRTDRKPIVGRVHHSDGSWRWLEACPSRYEASDGSARTILLARDITDRKRAELGRDLLWEVVQRGGDLILICDPDGRLIYANEAATRALVDDGADPDLVGRTLFEFLTDGDAERLRTIVLPKITAETSWTGELALRPAENTDPIPTEATLFLVTGSGPEARSLLAVTLRDISKRRSAEEALRLSELRLNQAQKMEAVGRLAGGIAHDFNNLLTAIIGYSDLVLDELGPGHGAFRDTEEILKAAERAGGLTRQLLAFSRRQVLQPTSVDLNSVVSDIDRMMRRLIGEDIELVTLQDGELRRIVADRGQVEQVIVNLVVNARDAMPMGGRIEIETSNQIVGGTRSTDSGPLEPGEYVMLRISDTGTGMDEAVRAQIFEPFFTTKEANQGTGLGLASVYGIVSQSGGRIEVESVPGEGTTFRVYLPATCEVLDELPADGRSHLPRGSETVLVVEDSESVRRMVGRTLRKAGYRVLLAESATAALRHCSRYPGEIDLLLTDVVLPRIPGPEIARRVSESRSEVRILFMSGFTDETLNQHGLEPTTGSLIEKPFSSTALLRRVRNVLDQDPIPLEQSMFHVEQPE
ncbi:MAG TPA: PAS domain S-box protein [Deltaproteobacteria bacterium]|nr:PAS domain S-box protein [Deltaproteobacteria bacterium]